MLQKGLIEFMFELIFEDSLVDTSLGHWVNNGSPSYMLHPGRYNFSVSDYLSNPSFSPFSLGGAVNGSGPSFAWGHILIQPGWLILFLCFNIFCYFTVSDYFPFSLLAVNGRSPSLAWGPDAGCHGQPLACCHQVYRINKKVFGERFKKRKRHFFSTSLPPSL